MKKAFPIHINLRIGGVILFVFCLAWVKPAIGGGDLSRTRNNLFESWEIFKIENHEVLSELIQQIHDLPITDLDKTLPLYFGMIDYVRKNPDQKPMITRYGYNQSNFSFLDPKYNVYLELSKMAGEGRFDSDSILFLKGVNALIPEIYQDALLSGNVSLLDNHIEKMIVSHQRVEMFQTVISFYMEQAKISKAAYYMSLYKFFAPRDDALLTNYMLSGFEGSQEDFKQIKNAKGPEKRKAIQHLSTAETNTPFVDDGEITVPRNRDGTYTLERVFEKNFQTELSPLIHVHPHGFLIEDDQFLNAYSPKGKKLWFQKMDWLVPIRDHRHLIIADGWVILNRGPFILILDLNTGKTLHEINPTQSFPGSLVYGMHAVDQKLYMVTVQNMKKLYVNVIDLKNFKISRKIYLAEVMARVNQRNEWQVVHPSMQIHFAVWGHLLFISTSLWGIYGVDMEQESLDIILKGYAPQDMMVHKNHLWVSDSNSLTSFDLLQMRENPSRDVDQNLSNVKGVIGRNGSALYVMHTVNTEGGMATYKVDVSNDAKIVPHDIWPGNAYVTPIYTKNYIYFYAPEGLTGYKTDFNAKTSKAVETTAVFLGSDNVELSIEAVRDAQIAHGMIFLTGDHQVVAYGLKEINERYLADLKSSVEKWKEPNDRVRFLMQFIDEEASEVRHYVKKSLAAEPKMASDLLLASLDRASDQTKLQMEDVLDEILYRVTEIQNVNNDGAFYEKYFDLLVWGYEKISDQIYREGLLIFAGSHIKDPAMVKLYLKALDDPLSFLKQRAIGGLTAMVNFKVIDANLIFDALLAQYQKEQDPQVRVALVGCIYGGFTEAQRKKLYYLGMKDPSPAIRQTVLGLFFTMLQESKSITSQDIIVLYRFLEDEGEDVRKQAYQCLFGVLESKDGTLDKTLIDESRNIENRIVSHFGSEKSAKVRLFILQNQELLTKDNRLTLILAASGDEDRAIVEAALSETRSYLKDHDEDEDKIYTSIDGNYDKIHDQSYRNLIISNLASLFSKDHKKALLTKALNDEFIEVHEAAANGLFAYIEIVPDQKDEILIRLFNYLAREQKSEEVFKVMHAHREIFSFEQQYLFHVGLLSYDNEDIRQQGITGLFDLVDQDQFKVKSLDALFNHYQKEPLPQLRHQIVFGWGILDTAEMKSCLLKAASDSDETVRSTAQTFLKR